MGKNYSGESLGGRQSKPHGSWNPSRGGSPKSNAKPPRGASGHSLGGGAARAKKGSDSCAVVALALLGGALTAVGAAAWGVVEVARYVI